MEIDRNLKVTLTLTAEQLMRVGEILGEAPFRKVAEIIVVLDKALTDAATPQSPPKLAAVE